MAFASADGFATHPTLQYLWRGLVPLRCVVLLFAFLDQLRELRRFLEDRGGVTSVRIVVFQQHRDHPWRELVRLSEKGVTEALFFVVAQDDNRPFMEFLRDQLFDLGLKVLRR